MTPITRLLTSRRTRALCVFGLLCVAPTVTSAVECSEIEFRGVRSTICQVDIRSDHLRLFLSDESGAPFNSFQRLADSLVGRGEQLLFAMNAGMYREDYSPVGLMVREGRQVHRLNLATGYGNFYLKPNGVFVLTASGARLVESSEYRSLQETAIFATQSGPLLLYSGQINAALNPQGTSRLIRNGVGVVTSDRVVFAISEDPVSFYEFALLFRDRLNCADALYLDGNVSSLYSKALNRNDNRVPLGPMVAVTASRSR
jgi:uncharacterized protein YigE (DUF2233 family)